MRTPAGTALLLLCLAAVVASGSTVKETREYVTLALDWAMNWGSWGPDAFCPAGSFAYAFQIKVESEGAVDDTSMNGIELVCRAPADVGQNGQPPRDGAREYTITSTVQQWGDWKGVRTCTQGYLTGLRMKSEEDQGAFIDDTAANDLEMQCDHSTTVLYGGGNHWGYWSTWESCPQGWAICGLQTRVEEESAADDTALNDVRMYCCQIVA